jgi:hypothetical protein
VGIGLDVLGTAGLAFGIYQNSQVTAKAKAYDDLPNNAPQSDMDAAWDEVESAKTGRTVGYVVGGVLLAGGLAFHFVF